MSQTQKGKPAPQSEQNPPAEAKDLSEKKAAVEKSTDDLIDEIDEILEKDAETFVKQYVQRGGE